MEAKPKARPAQEPESKPSDPEEPGRVLVRIESNEPLLQLHQDMGTFGSFTAAGSVVENSLSRLLCRAPCGVIVDGRNGQSYYLTAHDQRIGPSFRLHDQTGAVTLRATFRRPVSPGMKQAGAVLAMGSGVALVHGIVLTGLGESQWDDGMKVAGGISFGIAAAALVVGIPLLVLGRGIYDVDVPRNDARGLPRFAGVHFTFPFSPAEGHRETMAALGWTF